MAQQNKRQKSSLRQVLFTRFMIVVAFFVLWICGISLRLIDLQVTQHAWLKERAQDLRQDVKHTPSMRGTIYDRTGRALAMSIRAKTLYMNPLEIKDVDSTAAALAKALTLDSGQLVAQIRRGRDSGKRFDTLLQKVDEETFQRINRALDNPTLRKADLPNMTGLHWQDDQKRSYPYQTLAAQVIGFSDAAGEGKAGIEQSQEEALHGKVSKRLQERDRLGRVFDETVTAREASADVVLTLDVGMQYMVEEALERGVRASNSKSGIAIVMSPKTGEILAMANFPTFDPNIFSEKSAPHISNRAVQSVYSPGSVFKLVTYGAALEKKLFTPTDPIDSGNGTIEVAKHVFTDSHNIGRVSYSQAMAHSSNVCAIKTALSVGQVPFYDLVRKMGFGSVTGVELPAETKGIVRPVERWNGDSLASMSIGYEIGVTALQMTSAFATIANNGIRLRPRIVKEIRRSDHQSVESSNPLETQVVTAATARYLKTMLRQVVVAGTGRRAQLNGYSVAGKTGTAWKFDAVAKRVDSSKYISSFIGMAPADDPEIVVAVVMDEPMGGARDGGMVSAPVFREISQNALQALKVAPDEPIRPDAVDAQLVPAQTLIPVQPKNTVVATNPVDGKPQKDIKSTPRSTPVVPPAAKQEDVKKGPEKKALPEPKLTASHWPYHDFPRLRPRKIKIET